MLSQPFSSVTNPVSNTNDEKQNQTPAERRAHTGHREFLLPLVINSVIVRMEEGIY
jgi:hypothetical protein